jgi:hypothetical protein
MMDAIRMLRRALLACLPLVAAPVWGQAPPPRDLYREEIQPLLARSCLACHSEKIKQGGLDLSTREGLLRGSEHGPVVTPGKPEESQLYKLVAHIAEPGMPFQGKKLAAEEIAKVAEWIRAGVPYGSGAADGDLAIAAEAAKHWAFRKPARAPLPEVGDPRWSRNPVDAFIAAGHRKRGLSPVPASDKRTLLRRVYLDLIGLPPTPEETSAFLADRDPRAYEKVVDRLLERPGHGERWGRHWLDIWRYSDWYGWRKQNQVRYSQRHIWRWRDWTIEAINRNKAYDRMILEMLAGDELAPGDPDIVRATGYLARNWYMFNRNVIMQDVVEYTSAGFLGLTLKCARCHAHKYDPIPHSDYYRFRAFFEPFDVRTDRVPGEADTSKNGLARVYDADSARPTHRFLRGNENTPDTSVALEPGVPVLFGKTDLHITPVELPASAYFPDGRAFVPEDLLAEARARIQKAAAELQKARAKPEAPPLIAAAERRVEAAEAAIPALEARIRADRAAMSTPAPPETEQLAEVARKLERRANFVRAEADLILAQYEFERAKSDEKKLAVATQNLESALKALKEPAEGYTPTGPKYPATSTGRRLALARWIASRDNPLTARVAINDMWLRHFGKPLVPTVFNFGRGGKPASHPELLDWLAVEFMERGWDMKAIHRLIVTSNTYKLQSGWPAGAPQAKTDPDNVYLWRANVRRMEAEAVRDSLLALAGELDTTMGGPEIDETKGHEIYRRSVYFRHAPDLQMDMLKAFDVASPNECFARNESIVPQQALALANGRLSARMARTIAAMLSAREPSSEVFVERAFDRVLGRLPTAAEKAESVKHLAEQAVFYRSAAGIHPSPDPVQRARESLVHVLINHNDFVTIR